MVDRRADPFALEPVAEVRLDKTPLFAVLFQARLPGASAALTEALKSGGVHTALQADFPYSDRKQTFQFIVQPGQDPVPQASTNSAWQFYDAQRRWTAAIDAQSMSLTTNAYESRTDFCRRAERLLRAVASVAHPPEINRLGIRYLNRVAGEEVLTGWLQNLSPPGRVIFDETSEGNQQHFRQAMSEVLYTWPSSSISMQSRWGLLAPNAFIDGAMGPIGQQSWVLDIDTFDASPMKFDPAELSQKLGQLAQRAYRFFRWVVSDESIAAL